MNEITTIGLDLAKNVFQVHGVDETGQVVVRKRLRRDQVRIKNYKSSCSNVFSMRSRLAMTSLPC